MGVGYARIVRRLLESDFGEEAMHEDGVEDDRLSFVAAFEKTIVSEMESFSGDDEDKLIFSRMQGVV